MTTPGGSWVIFWDRHFNCTTNRWLTPVAFGRRSFGLRSEGGGMVAVESAIEEKRCLCVRVCVWFVILVYPYILVFFFWGGGALGNRNMNWQDIFIIIVDGTTSVGMFLANECQIKRVSIKRIGRNETHVTWSEKFDPLDFTAFMIPVHMRKLWHDFFINFLFLFLAAFSFACHYSCLRKPQSVIKHATLPICRSHKICPSFEWHPKFGFQTNCVARKFGTWN